MQCEPLLERLVMEQRAHGRQQAWRSKVDRLDGHAAGLDPGDLQDVADHLEQGLAGAAHGAHHVLLLAAQRAAAQQVGHADDGVQRRAQLVAHGREEPALGAARLLGAGERIGELGQQRRGIGRQHGRAIQSPVASAGWPRQYSVAAITRAKLSRLLAAETNR